MKINVNNNFKNRKITQFSSTNLYLNSINTIFTTHNQNTLTNKPNSYKTN